MKTAEQFEKHLQSFLNAPSPLWETDLTDKLVKAKYDDLLLDGIANRQSYSTAAALNIKDTSPKKHFLYSSNGTAIFLELPDFLNLSAFYEEHGLIPLTDETLVKVKAASKIKKALDVLGLIPDCIACIAGLVNCIQVVESDGRDYDTSYSHPDLPFTIFVSVCEDDALSAGFRVAESILHEAMHLKLTLIQQHIDLVKADSAETFFSPWRNVQRPLIGVLHGLFVFRSVSDFYQSVLDKFTLNSIDDNFLTYRIADIKNDFEALQYFSNNHDLTKDGASLSANLLPLN